MTSMTSLDQSDGFRSTVPMFAAIGVTAVAFAGVIAWQVTGVPIVAILLIPWLASMVCLAVVTAAPTGSAPARQPAVRDASRPQRMAVAGVAAGAIVAAATVSGFWAAIPPDSTAGRIAGETSATAESTTIDSVTLAGFGASRGDC